MSPRLRLIAALLLVVAVVAFCVSCHQHNTLITTFRAEQAAVALGVMLAMAATALSELLPWPAWTLFRGMMLPAVSLPAGKHITVLLC
ncbi:MAG TPA: hypothetical protein VFP59_18070 [Candidatus Angelobacter sp.]|nr:hypothetical protein [Candidatus Angelobacter sp.]